MNKEIKDIAYEEDCSLTEAKIIYNTRKNNIENGIDTSP